MTDALDLTNDRDLRITWVAEQRKGEPKENAVEVVVREREEQEKATLPRLSRKQGESL